MKYDAEFFVEVRKKVAAAKAKLGEAKHFQLNPILRGFWQSRARNKVLHGGRASSKSHDAAGMAVYLTSNFCLKFMCARRFQARISESVYTLVKNKIEESPFRGDWKILQTSMVNRRTGSEFLFYGIEKNLMEIKSTEGVDVLWLEEANYITAEHWKVLEPTIRKENSEVWFIFNPDFVFDFVYDNFVMTERANTIVQQINWWDNPWLSDTMIDIIEDMYKTDPELADHVYGGEPRDGGDKMIIPLKFITAALDAHTKIPGWDKTGKSTLGFDVADDGDDLNAMVKFEGNICDHAENWKGLEDELGKSCSKVWNFARDHNADITYDSIGVGASSGSKFSELNADNGLKIGYSAFNAGGGVRDPDAVFMRLPHMKILNKDQFENAKAQEWFDTATAFRKTYEVITNGARYPVDELISIDTTKIKPAVLKELMKELSCVQKDVSARGKFMAEKKEKLRDRGIKSPNMADAFIMGRIKAKKRKGMFANV